MSIENMAEFFGCDGSEIFEEKQKAEGYLAGTKAAAQMQQLIWQEGKENNRPRCYVEAVLEAMREQL